MFSILALEYSHLSIPEAEAGSIPRGLLSFAVGLISNRAAFLSSLLSTLETIPKHFSSLLIKSLQGREHKFHN